MTPLFLAAFELLIGHEGGFTQNPRDKGNWTGGKCGAGACKGTKYGVSAASYPDLDIMGLTLAQAQDIYWHDYWGAAGCDLLPPAVAFLVFDAAVNCGVGSAARWLQSSVGVASDGKIGPVTAAAVRAKPGVAQAFLLQRLAAVQKSQDWPFFGKGWAVRIVQLAFEAQEIGERFRADT